MLNYLTIQNFALIENAELEFSGGFTVVTGESGAGKSILMSAIELLTGGRVERSGIRSGCRQFTVCGEFSIPESLFPQIHSMLDESGIEISDENKILQLRRVIGINTTRNFINDIPVSAKLLADIGGTLIDLHGANEQISLTVPARQLELLDNFGNTGELKNECFEIFRELKMLSQEKADFENGLPNSDEADRYSLIAEEIDRISPAPGEDEDLAARQKIGANARSILETLSSLSRMLTENENCIADQLGSVYHSLSELAKIDPNLTETPLETCASLQSSVAELSADLSAISETIDLDPESLAVIEARLGEIHTLKRRYGPTLEHVFEMRQKAGEKLAEFNNAQKKRQEFANRETELKKSLADVSEKLSIARKNAAHDFLSQALKKLAAIGFEGAAMDVEFSEIPPGANGKDKIELLFNANCGEELRPLRKIASSGELSRIMLALKTVLADADAVPTVIFDEIDMNIGGQTANKVAAELHNLGKKRQIFCISHLAQVAARADQHILVAKRNFEGRTYSEAVKLNDPVPELARMLGGGDSAMRHARELRQKIKKNQRT